MDESKRVKYEPDITLLDLRAVEISYFLRFFLLSVVSPPVLLITCRGSDRNEAISKGGWHFAISHCPETQTHAFDCADENVVHNSANGRYHEVNRPDNYKLYAIIITTSSSTPFKE